MIKTCMSENHGFVIVLQNNNNADFGISKKGTYVEIIDFNNLPNGLLGITVKSENKVSIKNIYQLEGGLHVAEIKPEIDPEVDNQALIAEYPETINILSQLVKHPKINELPIKVDFNSNSPLDVPIFLATKLLEPGSIVQLVNFSRTTGLESVS